MYQKNKEVVEDSKMITLSELNTFIILMRETNTKALNIFLEWSYQGKNTGNIGLNINLDKMCLTLMYYLNNRALSYKVALVKKTTFNGGYKYFMICPSCGKPIRTLYKAPNKEHFLCRACSVLIYYNQKHHNKTLDNKFKKMLALI